MKLLKVLVLVGCVLGITACGTIGGTISGAGEDLTKAGNWIKSR